MNLIDRYIHEVGRHLPRKNRQDIQAELRSLLADTIEDRITGEPTEADIVAVLEEFGAPKKVAASYYPEGQYLIGPTLFPIFRMVVAIVLAAVLGAQLVSTGVVMFFTGTSFNLLDLFTDIMNSIPTVVGSVVIVFAILQWSDVKADVSEASWNPKDLPEITEYEPVKSWERIIGIVGAVFILGLLTLFPDWIGFVSYPGGYFFANPVLVSYRGWISLVLVLSIALDIHLLRKGQWQKATRISKIFLNLLNILVLILLIQGHTVWLVEHGVSEFFTSLEEITGGVVRNQVFGMQAFRLAFGIALITTLVETVVMGFRVIRVYTKQDIQVLSIPLGKSEN